MAKDPYKYFRVEARELIEGLSQGILQLEQGAVGSELVARLLRLAHTLKGAARVVKQPGIAELTHTLEDLLTAYRNQEGGQPLALPQGSELLRLLDGITALIDGLDAPDAPSGGEAVSPVRPAAEVPIETLRVEIPEMDALLRGITEAGVHLGAMHKGLLAADGLGKLANRLVDHLTEQPDDPGAASLAGELRSGLERVQRSLSVDAERIDGTLAEIREVAHRLRLIPVHTVFPALERAVRDAAQALGKRVHFEVSGGDVRLDTHVLGSLRDALTHVVRNAVVHGVETEGERIAAGKAPMGRVRLEVARQGSHVTFVCQDDGRGIDVVAVRKAAAARGLMPAADVQSLSPDRVIALLRTGGISTAGDVTQLSGRGIGLDVARATMSRLNGVLEIRSEPGRGATIEMGVPVSLAALSGLIVDADGVVAAIPLDAVRQTLRMRETDLARTATGDSLCYDGQVIPFLPLERALWRAGAGSGTRRTWSAVVVEAGERRVAIGVDRLLGTANIVMWSLPGLVEVDPIVAGASLDAEGYPQLVLDPGGLVAAAEKDQHAVSGAPAPERAPVLVIDDSLTTRMLEQSILESAGYTVELAVSAEEGLTKARERRYSLFIVDVEMPGMDGFAFVTLTRADPVLREIPAILVTSRNAVEDRRRGEQAGAYAYIVKGEFDQGHLLHVIRTLIG